MGNKCSCTPECFSAGLQVTNEFLNDLNNQINNFSDTANKIKFSEKYNPKLNTRRIKMKLKKRGFSYKAKTVGDNTTHVVKKIKKN